MTTGRKKTNKTHSARHHKWHKGYNHSSSCVYILCYLYLVLSLIIIIMVAFCDEPHVRQAHHHDVPMGTYSFNSVDQLFKSRARTFGVLHFCDGRILRMLYISLKELNYFICRHLLIILLICASF